MQRVLEQIDRVTRSECHNLLIEMTNEYIEYRNQIFDSSCIYATSELEDEEDAEYIRMMDVKIQRVLDFLE